MMKELDGHKLKISELCNRGTDILNKAGLTEKSREFQKYTSEILAKTAPSLMFYGIYNAGKSSIINAIFGENIAAVGDVPTTREIQTVDWKGFKIVDTPGINANNEHTLVAKSEIDKSDVVLFVIDDMNVEEISFYKALIEVLKKEIHVIIVINQKQADYSLEGSDRLHQLNGRIMELVQIASKKAGMSGVESSKYFHGVIPVNAFTARTSQSLNGEDEQLLYNESNLEMLIREMQSILDASNGTKMLIPAVKFAEQSLDSAANELTAKIENASEQNLLNTIGNIKRQRDNLYNRLITEGKATIGRYKNLLLSSVGAASAPDVSGLNNELADIIRRGFNAANIELREQFDLYKINIGNLNIKQEDFSLSLPKFEENDNGTEIWDTLSEIFKRDSLIFPMESIIPVPPEIIIAEKIPELLSVLLSIFKSKQKKEQEKQQREAEIQVEVNRANAEVERQINERVTTIMEYNRQISSEMSKLEESYTAIVTANVDAAYSQIIKKLESEISSAEQSNSEIQNILKEVSAILGELNAIKSAIIA